MMWFLDREVLLAVVCIAGILMTWFMWQWWSNLGDDDATTGA
jgi:TRAP-type C4-dicarboxylate transport system permease small subunit